jgi:hypothetical protein
MNAARLLAVAPLLFASCDGPIVEGEFYSSIQVSPRDGTTGLQDLTIVLSPGSRPRRDAADIAAASHFFTWPELAPVATTADVVAGMEPTVRLSGDGSLGDRWYVAVIDDKVATMQVANTSFVHVLPDGRAAARVRRGSAPALWGVAACDKTGGITAIVVTMSEAVRAATTATMPLTVAAGPAGAERACAVFQAPLADLPVTDFEYGCPSLADTDSLSITVTEGLVSEGGVGVAPTKWTGTREAMRAGGFASNCLSLKLDP